MGRSIAVIVKVTDQCNLACPYCYYYAGTASDLRKRKFRDLPERIEALNTALSESRLCREAEGILFALHGGEPLLVPKPEFAKLCAGLRKTFGATAQLAVQTNGVLVDDEWSELFVEFSVSVSVSLDGPAWLHDANRPDTAGRGSHGKTLAGLRRLQSAAAAGRLAAPAVLAVFDPRIRGEDYFQYFFDEAGVRNFDLLFPDDAATREGGTPRLLEAFSAAARDIWSAWLDRDDPRLKVRFIDHALRALVRGRPVAFDPETYQVLVIDMKGDCFVEDALRAVVPFEELRIGNWLEEGLDPVMERVIGFADRLGDFDRQCLECNRFSVCKGGDFSYRYDAENERFGVSALCDFYRENFDTAERVLGDAKSRGEKAAS